MVEMHLCCLTIAQAQMQWPSSPRWNSSVYLLLTSYSCISGIPTTTTARMLCNYFHIMAKEWVGVILED